MAQSILAAGPVLGFSPKLEIFNMEDTYLVELIAVYLVAVATSRDRSCAGLCRFKPVDAGAGPKSRRDLKKRCK